MDYKANLATRRFAGQDKKKERMENKKTGRI
jgi:hypothetical protein